MDNRLVRLFVLILVIFIIFRVWNIYAERENKWISDMEHFSREPVYENAPNLRGEDEDYNDYVPAKYDSLPMSMSMEAPIIERRCGPASIKSYDIDGRKFYDNTEYFLDDGANGALSVHNTHFSPSCCPPQIMPYNMPADNVVDRNREHYVLNNYTGNTADNNAGCMCMTREQQRFLQSRGGNGNSIL